MSKKSASENLQSFSWIYIIVSLFYVVGIIICNVMPELKNGLTEGLGNDAMLSLNITAGVVVVFNLWYFWLCRRVADGKSEGNLYMVLLILGIVGSLVTIFIIALSTSVVECIVAILDTPFLYFVVHMQGGKVNERCESIG